MLKIAIKQNQAGNLIGKKEIMEDKIEKLYNFLKENRQYNKQVQEGFIKSCIAIDGLTTEQKVLNLLYGVVNTQSRPKMNAIGEFFKKCIIKILI